MRECRRSKVDYKKIAMKSLTTLLKEFKINKFVEFKSIVVPLLEESEVIFTNKLQFRIYI